VSESTPTDIDALVNELTSHLETDASATDAEKQKREDDLYHYLERLNANWELGGPHPKDPLRLLSRGCYRALDQRMATINAFHHDVVRVLNKIVALLDGRDEEWSGELLERNRTRINLLAAIEARVDALEKQNPDTSTGDA